MGDRVKRTHFAKKKFITEIYYEEKVLEERSLGQKSEISSDKEILFLAKIWEIFKKLRKTLKI
jgi:hypothetical protein